MRRNFTLIAAFAVVAGLGGYLLLHRKKPDPEPPPVPVYAAAVESHAVPILMRGIGQVQAFNTVTVRSRIDGNITEVAFTEGQAVHRGDVLMQVDPRPLQAQLRQAVAAQAKDAATLENAKIDLKRYAELLQLDSISQQTYATQVALVAQLQATVEADAASVDMQRTQLAYTTITSPITGITGARQIDIGNYVSASTATPLVVVAQVKPIFVSFTIPEQSLAAVRVARNQGQVTVEAWDSDDRTKLATGVLSLIDNQVDQASGTVRLKAQFPNEDEALWPGQFVNARIILRQVPNGLTVPAAAVQIGPKGRFVFAIKPDDTVEMRPVRVDQIEAQQALIGQGLAAEDKVVTSGQARLQDGTKIAVRDRPKFSKPEQDGQPMDLTGQTPDLEQDTSSGPAAQARRGATRLGGPTDDKKNASGGDKKAKKPAS